MSAREFITEGNEGSQGKKAVPPVQSSRESGDFADEWVSRAKPALNRRSLRPRRSRRNGGIYLGYTFRGQNIRASVTLTIFIGISWYFIRAKIRATDVPEA